MLHAHRIGFRTDRIVTFNLSPSWPRHGRDAGHATKHPHRLPKISEHSHHADFSLDRDRLETDRLALESPAEMASGFTPFVDGLVNTA